MDKGQPGIGGYLASIGNTIPRTDHVRIANDEDEISMISPYSKSVFFFLIPITHMPLHRGAMVKFKIPTTLRRPAVHLTSLLLSSYLGRPHEWQLCKGLGMYIV